MTSFSNPHTALTGDQGGNIMAHCFGPQGPNASLYFCKNLKSFKRGKKEEINRLQTLSVPIVFFCSPLVNQIMA